MSLVFGEARVELVLGDRDQAAQLSPSADDTSVVWDDADLPAWEREEHPV